MGQRQNKADAHHPSDITLPPSDITLPRGDITLPPSDIAPTGARRGHTGALAHRSARHRGTCPAHT
eukprot:3573950-Prymnesium_polylepis.1